MKNSQSREVALLVVIGSLLILASLGYFLTQRFGRSEMSNNPGIACPQNAKQCPDGSYVGRVGPHCEFGTCTMPATTTPSNVLESYKDFQGQFGFNEFAPPNQTWEYNLFISSNTGTWRVELNIDGFQTETRIIGSANRVGDSLDVYFDSYAPDDASIGNGFTKDDVLFRLTPSSNGLVINWKKMQPQLSKDLNGSKFILIKSF